MMNVHGFLCIFKMHFPLVLCFMVKALTAAAKAEARDGEAATQQFFAERTKQNR